MLTELRIDNFAIIQHLELEFAPGFITFTGETGAGKSIILDAILTLMGGHADVSLIRAASERAMLEATFKISGENRAAIHDILKREDLMDDPDYLTLSRELRREGRSAARVNGRNASLNLLRELGSYLVDVHGQSEHLSLLNVRQHLGLLDRYAGSEVLLTAYQDTYQELRDLRQQLNTLRLAEADAAHRTELYTFQVQEIEAARLKPGEEENLRKERDRMANAESLSTLAQQSLVLLDEGSAEIPSITDQLGQVVQSLASISRLDSSQTDLFMQAEALEESLGDISRRLQDYLEGIEYTPRRLEQVEERLELIHNLKRKYGGSVEAVIAHEQNTRQKLDEITHAGERIAELEEREKNMLVVLAGQANELSRLRQSNAQKLAVAVEQELADLSMDGAHFKVEFNYKPDIQGLSMDGKPERVSFDQNGIDQLEFLIAPNPGEGFKPLVKIASGGETSRLMLALKSILARADTIPTLIFDEVDQGIGGKVGSTVGEKLWQVARRHQVLCVTHLPQLAAFGDQHFGVRKRTQGGRTLTEVDVLNGPARLNELAEMLGGTSDANRAVAQEALEWAKKRAKQLNN